jgi:hypothetical protein
VLGRWAKTFALTILGLKNKALCRSDLADCECAFTIEFLWNGRGLSIRIP